jgi:hypothetical protein
MDGPDLKVVGEIAPPDYRDPVLLLRNLADDIEAGAYGDVETIVVALAADVTYAMFGGGRRSSMADCGFLYAAAAQRLAAIPWGGE